ncbi:MAG: hypothetical protein JSS97_01240 [Actinobacteria bacterium]|nr:hypothetical protein [Actinomycetota bacterium]
MTAAGLATRRRLVDAARGKPTPPYELDPSLTFFCPQENVEGLDHPAVKALHRFKRERWRIPSQGPRVLLLMPCQMTKPYPLSREHQAINEALLRAGFAPLGRGDWPEELGATFDRPDLLSNAPLVDGGGVHVDRAVISEPFGVVPYETVYRFGEELSSMARYDDPGMFEHRGIGCTWREDCTATEVGPGRYRWGDNERAAYVEAHNRLAAGIAADLERVSDRYAAILGYVAPGMPHRSFLAGAAERQAAAMPATRLAHGRRMKLSGVGDLRPGLVTLLPTAARLEHHRRARGGRLTSTPLQEAPVLADLIAAIRSAARLGD